MLSVRGRMEAHLFEGILVCGCLCNCATGSPGDPLHSEILGFLCKRVYIHKHIIVHMYVYILVASFVCLFSFDEVFINAANTE